MDNRTSLPAIQRSVWAGRIPLEIILAPSESRTFDQTNPYLVRPLRSLSSCPWKLNRKVLTKIEDFFFTNLISSITASETSSFLCIVTDQPRGWTPPGLVCLWGCTLEMALSDRIAVWSLCRSRSCFKDFWRWPVPRDRIAFPLALDCSFQWLAIWRTCSSWPRWDGLERCIYQ